MRNFANNTRLRTNYFYTFTHTHTHTHTQELLVKI